MFIRKEYPDVLYLVRPSEDNDELKYSLRSLKNLNHGRVFIAGYKPSWVDERVEYIPAEQTENKYQNIRNNWLAALNDTRLSDNFILMNDDFFIMSPTKDVMPLRRLENIDHYIQLFSKVNPESYYVETMKSARDLLREWNVKSDYSYELHTPMLFNKRKMLHLFDKLPSNYPVSHIRTIYGNYYGINGSPIRDVKVINDAQDIAFNQQFLSTIDGSFESGAVGEFLRMKFAKVLVFSHANDPDGLLSVILAQLAFAEVDYKLTNNPQIDIMECIESKDLSQYEYIIISDLYPGRPVLKALPDAYWFDHKQHSLNKMAEHQLILPHATIVTEIDGRPASASELFYRWLKENQLISDSPANFVEYIRQHDTWDHQ